MLSSTMRLRAVLAMVGSLQSVAAQGTQTPCGFTALDFTSSCTTYGGPEFNNLAGMGPNTGPQEMRFGSIMTVGATTLDLVIRLAAGSAATYLPNPFQTVGGGCASGNVFGALYMRTESSTTWDFEFQDRATQTPITLAINFHMVFMDIDIGDVTINRPGVETMTVTGVSRYVLSPTTSVVVGGTASSPTFTGTIVNVPNPTDITSLTGAQVDAMVNTFFSSTAPFSVSFDIVGANTVGGRSLRFYGTAQSPACPPPPPAVMMAATARADPHFHLGHGDRTDIRGEDGGIYNFLSARNVSMNVVLAKADFHWHARLVHGTKMAAAAWAVRTYTGKMVNVSYEATKSSNYAIVHVSHDGSWNTTKVTAAQPFVLDNVHVAISAGEEVTKGGVTPLALTVSTGKWRMGAAISPFPFGKLNAGQVLLDVKAEALYDADHDVVAPHGIFGQAFDGDDLAVDGKIDKVVEGESESTTAAQGEGAIEGTIADYKMAGMFSTEFKYSRFDLLAAKPRDVTKLTGVKRPRVHGVHHTAATSVEAA